MAKGYEQKRSDDPFTSGTFVEQKLLGHVESAYFERFKDAAYLSFKQAMAGIKEYQPFDTTDPEPEFANDLHAAVANKLELDDYARLRFYTAVSRTHLDVLHGIDGFFEFQYGADPDDTVTATLDVTTHPKETWKADVLISVPPGGFAPRDPEDKKRSRQCAEDAAGKIVRALQNKIAKRMPSAAQLETIRRV